MSTAPTGRNWRPSMKTLVILSSILGDRSNSKQLADHLIQRLRQAEPGGSIRVRDLGADPLPYFDGAPAGALFTPADKRTAEQAAIVARRDALVAELFDAARTVFARPVRSEETRLGTKCGRT